MYKTRDFGICGSLPYFSNGFPRFPTDPPLFGSARLAPNIPEDFTHWKAIFREVQGTIRRNLGKMGEIIIKAERSRVKIELPNGHGDVDQAGCKVEDVGGGE